MPKANAMAGGPETILATILTRKRAEVERQQRRLPGDVLGDLLAQAPPPRPFGASLQAAPAPRVIAEVKRASPSKGVLRPGDPPARWQPERLAAAYEAAGAAALSVLTDVPFFWGHPDALVACRDATALAVLRKDFIIDPYQVDESRWLGADAILLIARALDPIAMQDLAAQAYALGMDVLVEIYDDADLAAALAIEGALLGVNNRDLAMLNLDLNLDLNLNLNLELDLERSARLRACIPADRFVVAESGLSTPEQLTRLAGCGLDAFLIGSHLAKQDDPGAELRRLRGVGSPEGGDVAGDVARERDLP